MSDLLTPAWRATAFHVQGGEAVVGNELGGRVEDLVLAGLRGQSSPLAGALRASVWSDSSR